MPRLVLPSALAVAVGLSGLTALAPPALAVSPDVVINEVYGGGGNSGATFTNDFIELYNRGTTAVSLDGWSVQYGAAAGAFSSKTDLRGSIAPGGYYLVQAAAGAGGTDGLPTPDASGSLNLSGTASKVALVPSTTQLTCGTAAARCAPDSYRDLLGYGGASDFEGAPTPALSNTTAAARRTPGVDTDANAADFAVGAPTPRSSGTTPPVEPPVGPPGPPATAACDVTAVTRVPAIQGTTDTSPFVGQTVTTRGAVVGDTPGLTGFFVQDLTGDGDPLTSDGVFVFVPGANPLSATDVAVGDVVALTGTVKEFNGLTELDTLTALQKCGTAPVPAPVVYELPEPVQGDLERVEGMSVTVPTTLTVQQNFFLGRYGQLTLGSGGRRQQPTNLFPAGSAEAIALAAENARALVFLDDASSAQNPTRIPFLDAEGTRRAGDTVTGVTGVLDFGPVSSTSSIRDYRLQVTTAPTFASSGRPAAPEAVGGTLRAASFNVLNYFTDLAVGSSSPFRGANTPEEFARQKAKIVAAIAGLDADVVGLTEIQNTPGAGQDLVDGLNAATAPGRWALVADPANGVGTDAIKVAQIYRTDEVELVGASLSPREPNAFTGIGRNPVAQTYRERSTGQLTSLVINHFKSKGSCPAADATGNTDAGDGQGCWNAVRVAQAGVLASFVDDVATAAGDPDVLVVGDLNAYGEEDPVRALEAAGLVDLLQREVGPDAYSYVFDGLSGRLDHALATPSLAAQVTGATEWHINADEPVVLDYNTEFKPDDRYAPTPYRSSDHDPVLVGLALVDTTPPVLSEVTDLVRAATGPDGAIVSFTAPTATDETDGTIAVTCTPASGSRFPVGTTTVTCTATDQAGNRAVRTFTVTVSRYEADLSVTVSGPATTSARGQVSYVLTVRNAGPSTARDVTAVLGVSGLSRATATPATGDGSVRIHGTSVSGARWSIPTLDSGATVTLTLTGTASNRKGTTMTAVGAAASSTPDPRSTDNLRTATTQVLR